MGGRERESRGEQLITANFWTTSRTVLVCCQQAIDYSGTPYIIALGALSSVRNTVWNVRNASDGNPHRKQATGDGGDSGLEEGCGGGGGAGEGIAV